VVYASRKHQARATKARGFSRAPVGGKTSKRWDAGNVRGANALQARTPISARCGHKAWATLLQGVRASAASSTKGSNEMTDKLREQIAQSMLMFDALGEPRTRYVRVSLDGNHCVMHPREGDAYLEEARQNGDDSPYVVADVYLSEREFNDLPEHEGF
jgi:hypothetical protein